MFKMCLVACIAAVLLSSCAAKPTDPPSTLQIPKDNEQLIPLAVGNSWHYSSTDPFYEISVAAPYAFDTIIRAQLLPFRYYPNPIQGSNIWFIGIQGSGFLGCGIESDRLLFGHLDRDTISINAKNTLPKYPTDRDTLITFSSPGTKASVYEATENVTVPAGTFQALRFRGPYNYCMWFARGVGLVKWRHTNGLDSIVLTSYIAH